MKIRKCEIKFEKICAILKYLLKLLVMNKKTKLIYFNMVSIYYKWCTWFSDRKLKECYGDGSSWTIKNPI